MTSAHSQRGKKNLIAMIAITRCRTVMIDQFVAKMKQHYVTILNQWQIGKKNDKRRSNQHHKRI